MENKYFSIFICLSVVLAFSLLFSLENINTIDEEVLNSSKEVIQIGEFEYSLRAFLWRDFMPGASPIDGSPLMAVIKIYQNESTNFCTNLVVEKMWIDNDGDIWETDLTIEDYQESENGVVNYIARDGPKWTTGILVDVFVQIKDTQTNSIYYLKSLEVVINETC